VIFEEKFSPKNAKYGFFLAHPIFVCCYNQIAGQSHQGQKKLCDMGIQDLIIYVTFHGL
jgi:hypothetical protein